MHELRLDAYLVWGRRKFAERQPESLAAEEWDHIAEWMSQSIKTDKALA